MNNPVGKSMKKLSKTEMENIYGATGVEPNTTPIISLVSRVSRASSKKCAGTISAISGLVSYNKDCLG